MTFYLGRPNDPFEFKLLGFGVICCEEMKWMIGLVDCVKGGVEFRGAKLRHCPNCGRTIELVVITRL